MQAHSPFKLVADQHTLAHVCGQLEGTQLVAVDTEFVRESTYFPKLCLIQLATDKLITGIDCLAGIDLTPLFERLLDSQLTWIVHSGRQDLEVVWHAANAKPANVYDTQIAAALLGKPPQIGLREILETTLGVAIGKELTRTNWAKRPLPEAALEYALDDVRFLPDLWRAVAAQLGAAGRLEWFREDCRRALEAPLAPDPLALLKRTKGAGRLRNEGIAAALALLDWREQRAQQADRPRRWILADAALVALALRRPHSRGELAAIDGLPARTIDKSGDAILAAIAAAQMPRFAKLAAAHASERPDPALLKTLQSQVRDASSALGIEPEVLAAKRDIVACVLGSPPEHLRSGWRAAHLELPAV